jgi:hypothetical protein
LSQTIKWVFAGFGQRGREFRCSGNKGDDAQVDPNGNVSSTEFERFVFWFSAVGLLDFHEFSVVS